MSRCLPYPPPGLENKIQHKDNYLSIKEKKKGKKNKKEKHTKDGKEKKRKDKDESKPKQKRKKDRGSDTNTEGGEGKNCLLERVQGAEVDNRDTEFSNGLIFADNHNSGGNRFSREVYQNPRDSNPIPAAVYGSNQYYNSRDKFGMNSLHPISKNASRFGKESTKSVRVVNRSGGQQQQPNARNGFHNGEHVGPNHLHFSMKNSHGNLGEAERNDRCTNSSGGESARSYGYCNGDGPIHNHDHFVENKNQRHMHELNMKRMPSTKPVSVVMDHKLSSAMTEFNPPLRAGRREQPVYRMEETRSIFIGQKNNVPKSSLKDPFYHEVSDHRRRAEISKNHAENNIVKPIEDDRAKFDGSSVPKEGGGMSEGRKRKREDEKHTSKEEKAMRKQEKYKRKEEAKAKKREEKAKKKEISKSKMVNEFEKTQSSAEHGPPDSTSQLSQPLLQMELDSFHIVQSPPPPENLRPTRFLNVTPIPSSTIPAPADETERSTQDSRPIIVAERRHSVIIEDDSDSASTRKLTHTDKDRLLYQFPPLPEMEHVPPPTDEQDWLFNDSGGFRLSGRNPSPSIGVEVWAEALRIESADVFALPYVIPY